MLFVIRPFLGSLSIKIILAYFPPFLFFSFSLKHRRHDKLIFQHNVINVLLLCSNTQNHSFLVKGLWGESNILNVACSVMRYYFWSAASSKPEMTSLSFKKVVSSLLCIKCRTTDASAPPTLSPLPLYKKINKMREYIHKIKVTKRTDAALEISIDEHRSRLLRRTPIEFTMSGNIRRVILGRRNST